MQKQLRWIAITLGSFGKLRWLLFVAWEYNLIQGQWITPDHQPQPLGFAHAQFPLGSPQKNPLNGPFSMAKEHNCESSELDH